MNNIQQRKPVTMPLRLQTLLLIVVGTCSSWIVFGIGGTFVFAVLLILAIYIRLDKSHWPVFLRVATNVLWFLVGISLLLPAISSARKANRRVQCVKNLKQIGLALRSYEDQYGCLPPPCIHDVTGRAKHSWRVLILPFLGYESLYEQYDFNEPWDGPTNRELFKARPSVYVCPADRIALSHGSTSTSYVAVVGANAAWRQGKMTRLDAPDLREQLYVTVLMLGTSNSGIQWTEPKDLSLDNLQTPQLDSAMIIRSPHMHSNGLFYYETPAGVNVALANGHTDFLSANRLTVDKLKRLLTVGGFTEENIAAYSSGEEEEPQINWPNCFALPVWIAVVALLLYQAVRSRKTTRQKAAE
ncbi:MAG: DUF1559 domain-containing protein [Pirellulales bacterium]|nr:DUF1559 domain-containing protein [Pirellulales bacterium]